MSRPSDSSWSSTQEPLSESWARWLRIPVYLGCLLAFLTDVGSEVHLFFGLFYLPLVCTAVFHKDPRSVWYLAGVAVVAVIIGFFLPVINPATVLSGANRGLSIVAIVLTAALVSHSRRIQERLAAQTERAEAAEQLKTEVFRTLSEEMRKPLHAMVGLTGVMMATCRQDQRQPLGQVQASSKRLVATIENLIDLTGINDRAIQIEAVDLDTLLHEACDAVRMIATERDIAISFDTSHGERSVAHGDAWAIRRIVDNVVANALEFSPPGASIDVSAETAGGSAEIVVRDTGIGMSRDVLRQLSRPLAEQDDEMGGTMTGTGSGLALSRRLADAMGATLRFDSAPGAGTTVTLRLPA